MAIISILQQDLETKRLNPRCTSPTQKPGRAGRIPGLAIGLKGEPALLESVVKHS